MSKLITSAAAALMLLWTAPFVGGENFGLSDIFCTTVTAETTQNVFSWEGLQSAVNDNAYTNGTVYVVKLGDNISTNAMIEITSGKNIVIDLNGYTLDRKRTTADADGHAFIVNKGGTLTIRDSSANKTGVITGGYAYRGRHIQRKQGKGMRRCDIQLHKLHNDDKRWCF